MLLFVANVLDVCVFVYEDVYTHSTKRKVARSNTGNNNHAARNNICFFYSVQS